MGDALIGGGGHCLFSINKKQCACKLYIWSKKQYYNEIIRIIKFFVVYSHSDSKFLHVISIICNIFMLLCVYIRPAYYKSFLYVVAALIKPCVVVNKHTHQSWNASVIYMSVMTEEH